MSTPRTPTGGVRRRGMVVRTRVTRRSEEEPAPDRIETSEYFEQVGFSPKTLKNLNPVPKTLAFHLQS